MKVSYIISEPDSLSGISNLHVEITWKIDEEKQKSLDGIILSGNSDSKKIYDADLIDASGIMNKLNNILPYHFSNDVKYLQEKESNARSIVGDFYFPLASIDVEKILDSMVR